jgi:hypothetical protein
LRALTAAARAVDLKDPQSVQRFVSQHTLGSGEIFTQLRAP